MRCLRGPTKNETTFGFGNDNINTWPFLKLNSILIIRSKLSDSELEALCSALCPYFRILLLILFNLLLSIVCVSR